MYVYIYIYIHMYIYIYIYDNILNKYLLVLIKFEKSKEENAEMFAAVMFLFY